MRSRSARIRVVSTALLLCACVTETNSTSTTIVEPTTPAGAASPVTTGTVGVTSSTDGTTTTVTSPATSSGSGRLPGEPISFGPAEGDVVSVVGVAHDDVLNLRVAPGADQDILEGVPPLYESLTALGHTRQLASGAMWILVDYPGKEGWVNLRFIAYLGNTADITASVVEDFGEVPGGETMLDLGMAVAESLAGDPSAEIVVSAAPIVGDLGEVIFDVTGFEDDSVRGSRIHVFGQPIDEGFVLDTVEVTPFCARGVDRDGFCV
jgi:hypothetical protein